MAVRDGLFYLIPLFVSSMAFSSHYTLFYQNYLHSSDVTVYLRTNLGSISARLAFIVQQTGSSPISVRVNMKICNESCAIDVNYGSLTTLTFDNNENNRIEFYQTTKGMLLYYGKCEQNVDHSRCRYKATENYKICICDGFTASCTNDELLHWGKNCSGSTQSTFLEDVKPPYAEALTKAKFLGSVSPKRRLYHSHPTSKANQVTTPKHAASRSGSGSRGPPVTRPANGPTVVNVGTMGTVTEGSTTVITSTSTTVTRSTSTEFTRESTSTIPTKSTPTEITSESTRTTSGSTSTEVAWETSRPTTPTESTSTEVTRESTSITFSEPTSTEVTKGSTPKTFSGPTSTEVTRDSSSTLLTESTPTEVTRESTSITFSEPTSTEATRESTPTTNTKSTSTEVTRGTTSTETITTGTGTTPKRNLTSTPSKSTTSNTTPTKYPSTEWETTGSATRESISTLEASLTSSASTISLMSTTEATTTPISYTRQFSTDWETTDSTARESTSTSKASQSNSVFTTSLVSTTEATTTPISYTSSSAGSTAETIDELYSTSETSTTAQSTTENLETDPPYPGFENITTDSENTTNTEETFSTLTIFEDTITETKTSFTESTLPTTTQLLHNRLFNKEVDLHNVTEVLNETLSFSENREELNASQIEEIAIILQKCANLSGIQPEDSQKVLLNIDYVLSADASEIANSSQVFLDLLPMLVQNTNATSFDFLEGENLGFTATSVDCDAKEGIGILDTGRKFKTLRNSRAAGDNKEHSIFISNADVCSRSNQASHMFVTIYRNRKLFIGPKQYNIYNSAETLAQRSTVQEAAFEREGTSSSALDKANSEEDIPAPSKCEQQIALVDAAPIMSGTIIGNDQDSLLNSTDTTNTVMATLQFSLTNILRPLHGHFRVTWWNVTQLEWSESNQCETTVEGGKLVATCNHLTDFALIVAGALSDPIACNKALYSVGYTVNSLSIMSLLFLTAISVSAYCPAIVGNHFLVYLRGYAPPTKDLVCLSHKAAMFLFYLVFTIFSVDSVSGKGCSVFASIAYMLLMSSVLLTIFQALRLTTAFALLTGPWVKVIILPSPAIIISILPPFVASLLLATLSDFFHRDDCFCWVRPDYIEYAVIIPTTIMVLNAIFCTIVICRRIFGRRRFSRSMRRREQTQIGSKIGAVFLMQLSMGTPWALQYLTLYKPFTTLWHYIFTIVMGSQGTMLAMLYLYKRQKSLYFYRGSYNISRRTKEESLSE